MGGNQLFFVDLKQIDFIVFKYNWKISILRDRQRDIAGLKNDLFSLKNKQE